MDTVQAILINTYNPNQQLRLEAEERLAALIGSPGSGVELLRLCGNVAGVHRDVRLASGITLKNNIRFYWENVDGISLSVEERAVFKFNILPILFAEVDNNIKKILAEIIRTISEFEFPANWPELLPSITAQVQSSNPLSMFNALLALRQIVKRLEFKSKSERGNLDLVMSSTFPLLQAMVSALVTNNSIEAAHILRMTCKVFWSCIQYSLPAAYNLDVNFWFPIFSQLLEKRLPEASEGVEPLGQPTDPDERKSWGWWKVKKWCIRIMLLFIQRYGNPSSTSSEYEEFAKYFKANIAIPLLGPVMQVLLLRTQNLFVTDAVYRMAIQYIGNAVEISSTYKALKPHIDFLLFQVLFPTLCLTVEEIELFESDPAEFVRKCHDPVEDFFDPRNAATNLLQSLARYRQKDILPKFLPFIQQVLSEYNNTPVEARDYRKKEGVLVAIGSVAKILRDSKDYNRLLLPFLTMHVIPEFECPVAFVRARAYWVLDFYNSEDYSEPALLANLVQGVLKGIADKSLPVQASAACALKEFIDSDETTEMLRPLIPQVVSAYFKIMEDLENDVIFSSLQVIMFKFGKDLKDVSAVMIERLLQMFFMFLGDTTDLDDELDDEAAMQSAQCLDTIMTVVHSVRRLPEYLERAEVLLVPVLHKLLSTERISMEYLDVILKFTSYFTYYPKAISQLGWSLCPPLLQLIDECAIDYMGDAMSPLLNYLTKDILTFFQLNITNSNTNTTVSCVQLLLTIVQKLFENDDSQRELDSKYGSILITTLLVCCKSNPTTANSNLLDSALLPILQMVLSRMQGCRTIPLRLKLLDIFLASIYYNPILTFQLLNSINSSLIGVIFNTLFDNLDHIDEDSSERVLVLAFKTLLFEVPKELLPAAVSGNVIQMFTQIIREIELIEEEAAKRANEEDVDSDDEYQNGEDDDEDDEEEDFGDEFDYGDDDNDEEGEDEGEGEGKFKHGNSKGSSSSSIKSALARLEVPDGGFDEDEDCRNAEDESYREHLERLDAAGKGTVYRNGEAVYGEDDEDDFDYTLPTDNIDVLLLIMQTIQQQSQVNPTLVQQLVGSLKPEDTTRLNSYAAIAQQRQSQA